VINATWHKQHPDELRKVTAADLDAARSRVLRDVIAPELGVLFCGINPGLYSGATGHHFARPGNRFWPALFASGFTPRLLTADEDTELPSFGCGVTNLVARTTATADELTPAELAAGGARLKRKVARYRPRWVAILGIGAYMRAFNRPKVAMGEQPELLADARVWVLPNPSGLNASYQLPALELAFRELRHAAKMPAPRRPRRP
jgi:TDG/mug DNA glycosylase family protein